MPQIVSNYAKPLARRSNKKFVDSCNQTHALSRTDSATHYNNTKAADATNDVTSTEFLPLLASNSVVSIRQITFSVQLNEI